MVTENSAYTRKVKMLTEREHLITAATLEGSSKKKLKKEEVKGQQDRITGREASAKTIVIINATFFACVFFGAFILFSRAEAHYNCVLSVSLSAALIAVLTSPTYI